VLVSKTPEPAGGWLEPQISLLSSTAGCDLAPEPIRRSARSTVTTHQMQPSTNTAFTPFCAVRRPTPKQKAGATPEGSFCIAILHAALRSSGIQIWTLCAFISNCDSRSEPQPPARPFSWVRVAGPLAPYARGLAAELVRLGYSSWWAQKQLRLAAHLSGGVDGAGPESPGAGGGGGRGGGGKGAHRVSAGGGRTRG